MPQIKQQLKVYFENVEYAYFCKNPEFKQNCLIETRIKEELAEDETEEVEADIFTDINEEEEKILLEENIPGFTFTIEEDSTQVGIGVSLNQLNLWLGSGSVGSAAFWLSSWQKKSTKSCKKNMFRS